VDTVQLAERIRKKFGESAAVLVTETRDPYVVVPAKKIAEVCRFLHDDPEMFFDGFSSLTGVDMPAEGSIDVVYHLVSYRHHGLCVLKVRLPREDPEVPSVTGVWKAANWFERETYDLLGVRFSGHPDLRRLLLPEDWEGHPLRKDYEEKPEYHGMETTREDPLKVLKPAPWGPAPETKDGKAEGV
jgi:NADH-quinone oxidoreductase subunit C